MSNKSWRLFEYGLFYIPFTDKALMNLFRLLPLSIHRQSITHIYYTVKCLNSGRLRVFKNLSVIKRCPLMWGSLTKIITFGTKHFVRYSRHVRYWEVSLYMYRYLYIYIYKCIYMHINMLCWTLLQNFIQQSLYLDSSQIQILLAVCRRFAMVRISDSGPGWK